MIRTYRMEDVHEAAPCQPKEVKRTEESKEVLVVKGEVKQ